MGRLNKRNRHIQDLSDQKRRRTSEAISVGVLQVEDCESSAGEHEAYASSLNDQAGQPSYSLAAEYTQPFSISSFLSLCRGFLFDSSHFRIDCSVGSSGFGLYGALANFVRCTSNGGIINESEVKQGIDGFFLKYSEDHVVRHLFLAYQLLALAESDDIDSIILAAATMFQRPIYVFKSSADCTRKDVFEYLPLLEVAREWKVIGTPELPIVLLRSGPTHTFSTMWLHLSSHSSTSETPAPIRHSVSMPASTLAPRSQGSSPNDVALDCQHVPGSSSLVRVRSAGIRQSKYKLYHHIPICDVLITEASSSTVSDRIHILDSFVGLLSGENSTLQKSELLKSYLKSFTDISDSLAITEQKLSPSDSLDFMFKIGLTWSQIRNFRTELNPLQLNIFSSEHSMREEMRSREFNTPMVHEYIEIKEKNADGVEVAAPRFCIRAPELIPFLREAFERTKEYQGLLDDEAYKDNVWLAIGGDKGGGLTKIVIAFGNSPHPSSYKNLKLLAMCECDETEDALRAILSPFLSEWSQLSELRLPVERVVGTDDQGKALTETVLLPVCVQLFGDLKFIYAMMGLSGASSMAPCPLCCVGNRDLKVVEQGSFSHLNLAPARSLSDWDLFDSLSNAARQKQGLKSKPILPIKIENVIVPSLHIMLGLAKDFFEKIQNQCFLRDLGLEQGKKVSVKYKEMCQMMAKKSKELAGVRAKLDHATLIEQSLHRSLCSTEPLRSSRTCAALVCIPQTQDTSSVRCTKCRKYFHLDCCLVLESSHVRHPWTCPQCNGCHLGIQDLFNEASRLRKGLESTRDVVEAELQSMKERCCEFEDVLKHKLGSSSQSLQEALKVLKIDLQAYQGGQMVGNQARKMLTGLGPQLITECLDGPNEEDRQLRISFMNLLSLLGELTELMGVSRFLTDQEISRISSLCQRFGEAYENLAVSDKTITPKMHILVNHVPHIAQTKKTIGLISEHGLEALHMRFNRIGQRYACFRTMARKMVAMTKQHQAESAVYRLDECHS